MSPKTRDFRTTGVVLKIEAQWMADGENKRQLADALRDLMVREYSISPPDIGGTLRTGEVPKQGEEYAVFRTHARSRRVQNAGPETLAGDLRTCADHYRAIVLGEEPDPELAQAFRELAGLGMKPVWPFLLHLYGDYAGGRLSRHDLVTLTRLVTAYLPSAASG